MRRDMQGGVISGAIIVLIGAAFLLDNMGIISIGHLFHFWPLLLIVGGLVSIATPQGRVKGVVLIIVGTVFQLDALGIEHFRWGQLWPLALIGAGLAVMWTTLEGHRMGGGNPGDPRNTLNEFAVFGGIERRITSQDFKGGSVTAIFGGVELDLRDVNIAGEQAELIVNASFGGCELRVPESWEVVTHGQGIFGGYVDSTRPPQNYAQNALTAAPRKMLMLRGIALFGGVEIKN